MLSFKGQLVAYQSVALSVVYGYLTAVEPRRSIASLLPCGLELSNL